MRIELHQPVGFTEMGKRENNEDSIFPPLHSVHVNSRLFLVCDGVGGQHKGEVASALACESISTFFENNPTDEVDENYVRRALQFTVGNFIQKESLDRETRGMATTLTLLNFHENGATIAHLGDSRIYQVRTGRVIRITEDHTMVNELVKAGHLTQEEASNHAQRNIITKVISADRNDVPDVAVITDVAEGDYFFLCSDGVLEQLSQSLLEFHLRETADNQATDAEKLENIRQECFGKTRDNFTAYLIRVGKVSGAMPAETIVVVPNPETQIEEDPPTAVHGPSSSRKKTTAFPAAGKSGRPKAAASDTRRSSRKQNSKFRILPFLIAATLLIAISAAGFWYKKKQQQDSVLIPEAATKPRPAKPVLEKEPSDKISMAKVSVAAAATESSRKKEEKEEKTGSVITAPSDPVIAQSERYNFSIKRGSACYYTWEPDKHKSTEIIYNKTLSIPDLAHYYRFRNGKGNHLYLPEADVKISKIDSITIGEDESIYYVGSTRYKVATSTGKSVLAPL